MVASTRVRLSSLRARADEVHAAAETAPPVRDLTVAITAPGLQVIAELKRRSPSRGPLNLELEPAELARRYVAGGAAALSVLTEPDHFAGSPEDLESARAAVTVPVLRKDFIIDRLQIWEARAMGADAVLLIAAILDDPALATLLEQAKGAGLATLVEVHSEEEARRALAAGALMVGVNNRDLRTFEVDLTTAERIAPLLEAVVRVAESGIHCGADAARMAAAGYHALLVGESLVRSSDPAALVAELREAAR